VTSSIRNGKIILEMVFNVECFRTEYSEVNEQFEVTISIRNWEIVLEM